LSATLPDSTDAADDVVEDELDELELLLPPPPPHPIKKARRIRLIPNFVVNLYIGFLYVVVANGHSY
jgi:hypothetical protein